MKLPGIPRGAINPTLPKPDLAAPGRQFQQTSQQIGVLGQQVNEAATKAFETQQRFEQEDATAQFANYMRNLEQQMAGKQFYSVDEIPEGVDVRRFEQVINQDGTITEEPRERIPSYEVNAALFEHQSQSAIQTISGNMSMPATRNNWAKAMQNRSAEATQRIILDSVERQQTEMREMYSNNIVDAMDNRNYDVARGLAMSDVFSEAESNRLVGDIRNRQERDTYDEVLATDDLDGMRRHLSVLQADDYNLDLNESERLIYVNKLKAGIAALQDNSNVDFDINLKRLQRDIDRTVNSIESGNIIDNEFLVDLAERTDAAYGLEPNRMVLHRDRLAEIITHMPELSAFTRANDVERAQHLGNMRRQPQDAASSHKLSIFEASDRNVANRISDDVLSLGADVGLVDLAPMPGLQDPEEFMEWLSHRQRSYDTLTARYGSGAHLTKQERDMWSAGIRDMTNEQRLDVMGMVSESLGTDAPLFWQQLTDTDGTYSVAGTVYAQGDVAAARSILNGQEFMQSGNYVKPSTVDMNMAQNEHIAGAYGLNAERKAILDSVNAVYADLAKRDGDYDASIFNERRYRDAVNIVTGGLITIGGSKVVPPERGMDKRTFDSYIRDVHTEWWREQGGVQGYENHYATLRDDIRRGQVKLVGVGQNEYFLYSEVSGIETFLLNKETQEPFVFRYDENARAVQRSGFLNRNTDE